MINVDWQTVAVLTGVTLALAYVTRRGWRSWKGLAHGGCRSCSGCTAPQEDQRPENPRVEFSIETLIDSARRQSK